MTRKINFTNTTMKNICNYFIGDDQKSIYKYRSGSLLIDMFSSRFGISSLELGPSRWMLCESTINYLIEKNELDTFFTTMLSLRNVAKELGTSNQSEAAHKRKESIKQINDILFQDDLELTDLFDGGIMIHKMDDEEHLLGTGGFAKVYLIPNTQTVVKKLKDEFKANDGVISRFKQEFYFITEKLSGIKGIIKGYEYNYDEISYTMEFCDSDLKKYLNNTHLTEKEKIDLIIEILSIMQEVHERQVLHRDLSPKNIFIKDGHPIIADFGLGKAIDENGRTYVTIDTSCNGTLEYCDPRQFQGLGFADKQSDIYSLGRIINYIMTKDSDNYKHSLTFISTIATESSLDARFHTIDEMISKIEQLSKNKNDANYVARCEMLLEQGYYDSSLDEYLLSFDAEEIIYKLDNTKFKNAYEKVLANAEYTTIFVNKLTDLHNICLSPIGHTFAAFDAPSNFFVDMLVYHKELPPQIKGLCGDIISDITCGINRWNAQKHFVKNAKKIELQYVPKPAEEMKDWHY